MPPKKKGRKPAVKRQREESPPPSPSSSAPSSSEESKEEEKGANSFFIENESTCASPLFDSSLCRSIPTLSVPTTICENALFSPTHANCPPFSSLLFTISLPDCCDDVCNSRPSFEDDVDQMSHIEREEEVLPSSFPSDNADFLSFCAEEFILPPDNGQLQEEPIAATSAASAPPKKIPKKTATTASRISSFIKSARPLSNVGLVYELAAQELKGDNQATLEAASRVLEYDGISEEKSQ